MRKSTVEIPPRVWEKVAKVLESPWKVLCVSPKTVAALMCADLWTEYSIAPQASVASGH